MTRKKYDHDFKFMIVELLKSGRTAKELSSEYHLNDGMIRRWKREFNLELSSFTKSRVLSAEEKALRALRKELREVTMEPDILNYSRCWTSVR